MFDVMKAYESVVVSASQAIDRNRKEGDYSRDGIVYCGKCNNPKTEIVNLFRDLKPGQVGYGQKLIAPIPIKCQCEIDRDTLSSAAADARKIQQEREAAMPDAGYREMTKENTSLRMPNMKHISLAMKYIDNWDKAKEENIGLLFTGSTGIGKTHLAALIANELIKKDVKVLMETMTEMLTKCYSFENVEEYMHKLESVGLLIIDDLGAEHKTDYAISKVFDIIDRRVRSGKPMIITTNIPVSEMENPKDLKMQRIYSRILGNCSIVQFSGEDIRVNQLQRKQQMKLQDIMN